MHRVYYDLHVHTALSPCADDDMTPNDIVGMSLLNGLDMIAVTDHNSLANAESVIKAAESTRAQQGKSLIVLPGIEVSTAEEVHVLCLFDALNNAQDFEFELCPFYTEIKNREDIFGTQLIYDSEDRVTGQMERMLIAPATISFDALCILTNKHGGAFIPAHVDRGSFSVISNLGFLPPHLDINTVEVTPKGVQDGFNMENTAGFAGKNIISSSDAHELGAISERKYFLLTPEKTGKAAIDYLR